VDPGRIRLLSGSAAGVRALVEAGYRLIVVSNQSGVARGYFGEEALAGVSARLRELLAEAGAPLTGFYYCPHHPEGRVAPYAVVCHCRKPLPGLIYRAALEHDIDLSQSWLVGDILDDIEAGRRAGCGTVLIDNGHETEWVLTPTRQPDFVAADLSEAARVIKAGIGRLLNRTTTPRCG
jgi:histidinol-phosphate phosphatase family protein